MARSRIEWTDYMWNPVTGCTKVSPGCKNRNAGRFARRLRGRAGYARKWRHGSLDRDPLKLRIRRLLAAILTYLPWTCHALVLAWGEIGGRHLLLAGLAPGAARRCMRDAAIDGQCYCFRFVTVDFARPVYEATRYKAREGTS